MKKPYVGITGFMNRDDCYRPLDLVHELSDRMLMIGILASLKTLRGQENNWKNRYPKTDQIGKIFPNHPKALNLIHYNTKDATSLSDQLFWLTDMGGHNLHGFQLNIAWPSPVELSKYRERYSSAVLVLQVGHNAMKAADYSPGLLLEKVKMYKNLIDYVLLDPSGGLGRSFDPDKTSKYLDVLYGAQLDLAYGVAGGLSPTTLNLVEPLVKEFPDLSIDAESRLRNQADHLDRFTAAEYIVESCKLFPKTV